MIAGRVPGYLDHPVRQNLSGPATPTPACCCC